MSEHANVHAHSLQHSPSTVRPTYYKEDVYRCGGATPVSDTTCVEGGVLGSHAHQGQLVWQERDVRRGRGEGVDIGEYVRWDHGVHLPAVEGHGRVGLIGTVESGIGTHRCTDVGVIKTNAVYGGNTWRHNTQ